MKTSRKPALHVVAAIGLVMIAGCNPAEKSKQEFAQNQVQSALLKVVSGPNGEDAKNGTNASRPKLSGKCNIQMPIFVVRRRTESPPGCAQHESCTAGRSVDNEKQQFFDCRGTGGLGHIVAERDSTQMTEPEIFLT